jgi:hypothetical protein
VLQQLTISGVKLPTVAKKFKIPENTLREWTKVRKAAASTERKFQSAHILSAFQVTAVRAIDAARAKNSGQLKANMHDPLYRLATSLKIYFEQNDRLPEHLRLPVTTKLIVAKVGDNRQESLLDFEQE